MSLKWFVVHCYPNKELFAANNLNNQGIITYIPLYKKLKRHARKVDTILAPLFPRYFFVQLNLNNNWCSINNTYGVNYLLTNRQGLPASISDHIIKELQNHEDLEGAVSLSALKLFEHGDKVRIKEGAFMDQVAIYEEMTDTYRVKLLINLIQRSVEISIPWYAIEKV